MNCDAVRHWLGSAEADDDDAVLVCEHLETCTECRAFAEAEDASRPSPVNPASLADEIQPPPDLWAQIEEKIQAEGVVSAPFAPSQGSGRNWTQVVGLITTVAAVVFLAIVIQPGNTPAASTMAYAVVRGNDLVATELTFRGALQEITGNQTSLQEAPRALALAADTRQVEMAIADMREAIERDGEQSRMLTTMARLCRVRLRLTEQAQELTRS